VLRRAADEVQVGVDPRWAVRIAGLRSEHVDRLVRSRDGQVGDLVPAPSLAALRTVGVLRAPGAARRRVRDELLPEALAHGLVRADGDGAEAVRRRARATVAVVGLDRAGATVASTLAAAGVGTLLLDDPAPVGPADLAGPVSVAELGAPRARALADGLTRTVPQTRVRVPGGLRAVLEAGPDVVVTAATDVTDPATALALVSADVAHLPVASREADALVGPFVVPQAPGADPQACLRCLDLHHTDADPAWPRVLAQLAAGGRARAPGTGPTAALAAVAGGLAAAEVLAHLDGEAPRTRGAQYEIAVPSAAPRLRRWAAHPRCGCAALSG